MSSDEVEHLRKWCGRTEVRQDRLTETLVERLVATIGGRAASFENSAPLGIHWCLAMVAVPSEELGADGHPVRGGFLPPVPLPRRMWAGGEISFVSALRSDDRVTRFSTVTNVEEKNGSTGRLVFVQVDHEFASERGVSIKERQDIVYRDAPASQPTRARAPDGKPAGVDGDFREIVNASPMLLFRYSALTFNSHRIHYDRDYCRDVEGYPGLLVHAPLQATLLMNLAARAARQVPARFTYRCVAPLFEGKPFEIAAANSMSGMKLWCSSADGAVTMSAHCIF